MAVVFALGDCEDLIAAFREHKLISGEIKPSTWHRVYRHQMKHVLGAVAVAAPPQNAKQLLETLTRIWADKPGGRTRQIQIQLTVEDHANARPAGGLAAAPGPGRALLIRWRFGSKPLPLACRTPRTSAAAATARTTFCAAPPSASSVMAAPGSPSPLTPPRQAHLEPAWASTPSMPMPLAWPRCLSMLPRGHRWRSGTRSPLPECAPTAAIGQVRHQRRRYLLLQPVSVADQVAAAFVKPKTHKAPLLVDQGTAVVASEPHRTAAAGQADALLDLVFAGGGGGHASCCRAGLLVVAPEAQHLHDPLLLQHLVVEAVLDVDAP
jgi:hypothetical protein